MSLTKYLKKYHYLILIIILAFAFFSRIWRLHVPEQYIFDEVYHALTAKLIARGDERAFEWGNPPVEPNTSVDWLHPPYAKYTQAFFIRMFGENTFGWRISSVIFGVLTILAVYKLAEELFSNQNLSLLAAFLASLDGLLLTQSRIAMNDIHVTFFILLTLIFYLRYHKSTKLNFLIGAGIAAGFAVGSKWSGVFAIAIILLFELIKFVGAAVALLSDKKKKKSQWIATKLKYYLNIFLYIIVLPAFLYLASYTIMFMQGKSLICLEQKVIPGKCYYETFKFGSFSWTGYTSHFGELHKQIWHYQTTLKATHNYQSRPYEWFLNLKPVWYHVKYEANTTTNIYAQGNTALFWLGNIAVIISLLVLGDQFTSGKKVNFNLFFVVVSYFAVWLPWQLSPRIMFFYHYTPAVPLLAIILAYWLIKVSRVKIKHYPIGQMLVILSIVLCSLNFIVFYPNWTGLSVPNKFAETFYFAIKSWK